MIDNGPNWQPPGFGGRGGPGRGAGVSPGPAGMAAGVGVPIKSERLVLGTVSGASLVTTANVTARVDNPSGRLNYSLSLAYEPNASGTPVVAGANPTTWSIQAMRPGIDGGRDAYLHSVLASTNAPYLWEGISAVRQFQVATVLYVPVDGAAAAVPGRWVLVAEWEPALDLCAEDISQLFSRCRARLVTPEGAL